MTFSKFSLSSLPHAVCLCTALLLLDRPTCWVDVQQFRNPSSSMTAHGCMPHSTTWLGPHHDLHSDYQILKILDNTGFVHHWILIESMTVGRPDTDMTLLWYHLAPRGQLAWHPNSKMSRWHFSVWVSGWEVNQKGKMAQLGNIIYRVMLEIFGDLACMILLHFNLAGGQFQKCCYLVLYVTALPPGAGSWWRFVSVSRCWVTMEGGRGRTWEGVMVMKRKLKC